MLRTAALVTFFALLCTVSALFLSEDDFPTVLLKRQAPGTPAYDCHLNCGTAITIGREAADPCTNSTFLKDYNACLDCAGPDDEDIWKYYGTTLATYGTTCGLPTAPVSNSTFSSNITLSILSTPASSISGTITSSSLVIRTSASNIATSSVSGTVTSSGSVIRTSASNTAAIPATATVSSTASTTVDSTATVSLLSQTDLVKNANEA